MTTGTYSERERGYCEGVQAAREAVADLFAADFESRQGWTLADEADHRLTLLSMPPAPPQEQGAAPRCDAMCSEGRQCEKPSGHGGNWHDCGRCCWSVERPAWAPSPAPSPGAAAPYPVETRGGESDRGEDIVSNPKSWIAWKREAERARRAALEEAHASVQASLTEGVGEYTILARLRSLADAPAPEVKP